MKYSKEDYINWPYADYNDFIQDTGHWVIRAAFFESNRVNTAKYTLKLREHRGIPSAYQIIANARSEHDAAMKLCGDWTIWLRWKASKGLWNGHIGPYKGTGLSDAMVAMEARIAGEALAEIITKSKKGDYRASKDLVTWGIPKKKTGKKVTKVDDNQRADIIELANRISK